MIIAIILALLVAVVVYVTLVGGETVRNAYRELDNGRRANHE